MNLTKSHKCFAVACLMCVATIALGQHKTLYGLLTSFAGLLFWILALWFLRKKK